MDIALGLMAAFVVLLASVLRGIGLWWPLGGAIAIFALIHLRRGYALPQLLGYCWQGAKQSWPVFSILLLIGAVISAWLAAGTVPALVYYGMTYISPRYFVLSAFVLTALVSTLIGTSFGAAGTIGLALMIMARSSGMTHPSLVAGAIIAGAYVGDRCSPLSSSAHLVATITRTRIYNNLKHMLLTAWLPLLLTVIIYGVLSGFYPLTVTDTDITQQILETFDLSGAVLLPALVVLVLAVARVNVKLTLLLSWLLAMGLAVGLQQNSLGQMLQFTLWGFRLEPGHGLEAMLLGGGLWPMGKVCSAVFFSTALSGLLSGTGSLQGVDRWLRHLRGTRPLFAGTAFTSFVSAAFGCTQTIAIVLTHQLVRPAYQRQSSGRVATNLAIDLENTAVVIAPLVPWNIAGLVPAAVLMAGPGFIPYAVYLYLVPLCNWVWPRRGYSLILRPSPMGNRALID
ncbi:MAG: Na+/H+ antiporter NhaC family protein [Cyanobacteria bacterium J06632_22]